MERLAFFTRRVLAGGKAVKPQRQNKNRKRRDPNTGRGAANQG